MSTDASAQIPLSDPIPAVLDPDVGSQHVDSPDSHPRRSPAVTLIVLASVTATIALLPYRLHRRHFQELRSGIDRIALLSDAVQHQLREQGELLGTAIRREEQLRLKSRLEEAMREVSKLRRQADELKLSSVARDRLIRDELEGLREESRHQREQLQVLRDLGTSLADVAAFMHEVDIRQGFWTQRPDNGEIERMRQIALRLQNISMNGKPDAESKPALHDDARQV
ncbi:hypothetical protein PUNSTDRAFT_132874 [Punctularia strigosozonata HHB-11173 SS5]|uniref:uncharacterized protein n=1 Tax=Punctularia strigosozonata (strain HHB-11173) TaxID=741275 RepID=UPI0004417A6C|nr:uncharacterized protein PUNSTDRAFT_132874 [Punctularia strigosozonata HHB-11173 SS5]EIN10804.1 hypothetical protein PUNSTDRAFT_132874 [Punctularia strigosozonata HHB-11173 SS5]